MIPDSATPFKKNFCICYTSIVIHALFDIDETLLSVPKGINAKTSGVMFKKVFGVDTNEDIIDTVGKTEKGIIREVLEKIGSKNALTNEIPEDAYKIWAQAMKQELKKNPAFILPGVLELLKTLSKNPLVKLEFLTGNSPWRAEEKLKSAGIDNFFRDSETNKLNGVFGNMAEKREKLFDIAKQQAAANDKFIIIDDSLIGAKMAKLHNLPAVLVATGKSIEEHLKTFTPNVFPDFGENRWQQAASIIETL